MRIIDSALAVLVATGACVSWANENDLTYYCAQPDSNLQYKVELGEVQRMRTREGPFLMIEGESDLEIAQGYLRKELEKIGLPDSCQEYLLSQAGFQTYAKGDLIARVYFDFDKSKLTKESIYILDQLEQDLQRSDAELLIEGHADSIGTERYNMQLGLRRAKAVESHMLTLGANQLNLVTSTQGEVMPIADNSTSDGRALNRRVDLTKAD